MIYQDFLRILEFFTNLPLPRHFLERREVATNQGKKEVACIVYKPLVSYFWGMWREGKTSKINHPGGFRRLCPPDQTGDSDPLPIFQDCLLLSNDIPETLSTIDTDCWLIIYM